MYSIPPARIDKPTPQEFTTACSRIAELLLLGKKAPDLTLQDTTSLNQVQIWLRQTYLGENSA